MKKQEIQMHWVKYVVSCFLFSFSLHLFAQGNDIKRIETELINSIINEKFVNRNFLLFRDILNPEWEKFLSVRYLDNNSGVNNFFEPVSTGLSEADIQFMKETLTYYRHEKWKRSDMKGIRLIKKSKKVDYSKYETIKLSHALFSTDFSTAIVAEEYTGGMENAAFLINIYKLKGKNWKKIAFIQVWIS